MKVGGSGSMRSMDGEVVEKETIKARYVVNCHTWCTSTPCTCH